MLSMELDLSEVGSSQTSTGNEAATLGNYFTDYSSKVYMCNCYNHEAGDLIILASDDNSHNKGTDPTSAAIG